MQFLTIAFSRKTHRQKMKLHFFSLLPFKNLNIQNILDTIACNKLNLPEICMFLGCL